MLEESILQGLVSGVAPCTLKEQLVLLAQKNGKKQEHGGTAGCGCRCQYTHPLSCSQDTHRVVVSHVLNLFIVISSSQLGQTLWVEPPTVWKELGTVLFGQLCAKGVNGDDEGAAVCFKLWGQGTCKERGKAVASQLAGLPPGLSSPWGPGGRWVGRYSPPGWGTWHRLWSHLAACKTCRRTPGRPVQSMGLV